MPSVDSNVDSISPSKPCALRTRRASLRAAALNESQQVWLRRRLHDELAQCLAFALIQLDMAREGPSDQRTNALVHVRDLVCQSLQVARDTLQAVEDIDGDDDALHLGLQRTVRDVAELSGCRIEADCAPIAQVIPAAVSSTLLRAARELLVNACKHAPGARIRLRSVEEKGGHALTVWVSDDGPGMDLDIVREGERGHFGLHRLPDELAALGVALTMRSSPGHGSSARLRWCQRVPPGTSVHSAVLGEAHG